MKFFKIGIIESTKSYPQGSYESDNNLIYSSLRFRLKDNIFYGVDKSK